MYAKNVYEIDQELGVGNCLFLPAQGWAIDQQERKKLQMPRGNMVTCQIEPGIIVSLFCGSSRSWRYAIH